jgi:hypothetical protein
MGTVRAWWQKLLGKEPADEAARVARPARPKEPKASGLELADGPAPKGPSRTGAAGFDPYSSDAGYSKPHSWERVDHD